MIRPKSTILAARNVAQQRGMSLKGCQKKTKNEKKKKKKEEKQAWQHRPRTAYSKYRIGRVYLCFFGPCFFLVALPNLSKYVTPETLSLF